MPELSRFLGIVIYMYFRDHAPPHFHAEYGEFEIIVDISTGEVSGKFRRGHNGSCWSGMLYIATNCLKTGHALFVKSR